MHTRSQKRAYSLVGINGIVFNVNNFELNRMCFDFIHFTVSDGETEAGSSSAETIERPKKLKRTDPNDLPRIFDGRYYKDVVDTDKIYRSATCINCIKTTVVQGSTKSTGNFKSHYRTKHPSMMMELENYLDRKQKWELETKQTQPSLFATPISKEEVCVLCNIIFFFTISVIFFRIVREKHVYLHGNIIKKRWNVEQYS